MLPLSPETCPYKALQHSLVPWATTLERMSAQSKKRTAPRDNPAMAHRQHGPARAMAYLRALAIELFRLVLPLHCAGCDTANHVLCPSCRGELAPRVFVALDDPLLEVWAGTLYEGSVRNAVARWKDRGRADCTPHIAHAAYLAGHQLTHFLYARTRTQETHTHPARTAADAEIARESSKIKTITLVPMPSRPASRRARGFVPGHVVAHGLGRSLAEHGWNVTIADNLAMARTKQDNVGLGARERRAGAAGALNAPERLRVLVAQSRVVLLVDDVVTTGSTLGQAKRVLRVPSGTLAAGFALAATPSIKSRAKPGPKHRDQGDRGHKRI